MIKYLLLMCLKLNSIASFAGQSLDNTAKQYVKLVLALGEHDSGYVDAYYGPKDWATAMSNAKLTKNHNISKAKALRQQVPAADSQEG